MCCNSKLQCLFVISRYLFALFVFSCIGYFIHLRFETLNNKLDDMQICIDKIDQRLAILGDQIYQTQKGLLKIHDELQEQHPIIVNPKAK